MKDKVEISVKKILLVSVIMVTMTALLVGIGTFAYFSATQVSGTNDFFTGSISFSVDGDDPWIGNFNATLRDIKPGMTGWANVTIHNTGENPADFWMNVTNITTLSYGTNSAKAKEPAATDIDGVIWYGLYNRTTGAAWPAAYVNPAAYTVGWPSHQLAASGALAASNYWIYLGNVQPGAANAVLVNQSFSMDSGTTNWAQLTNMTFTVDFYAQQSQGTPSPAAPAGQLAGHDRP